jgi:N-methylhydantoinase A
MGILTNAWPVIVPPGPGVLCAYGDATTQVQDEAVRTYLTMAGDLADEKLLADLKKLELRAGESLLADGIALADQEVSFQADLRYVGQAFQITVNFSEDDLTSQGVALLTEQFDAEHEKLFTFKLDDGHEILMIRAVAKAITKAITELKMGQKGTSLAECCVQESRFYYEGQWHDISIYDRDKLHEGLVVPGPAIVGEMDSTTVILPGYEGCVDAVGNLLITPVTAGNQ